VGRLPIEPVVHILIQLLAGAARSTSLFPHNEGISMRPLAQTNNGNLRFQGLKCREPRQLLNLLTLELNSA